MPPIALDVREEVAQATVRPFHWRLIVLISLGLVIDGINNLVPSFVLPFVREPWNLSGGQSGMLVSSGLIGVSFGALLHGPIADRFGRRPTFIAGMAISGILSVATGAIADSFEVFVALRIVTGLSIGMLLPLGIAYLNETMPIRSRHRLTILSATGFSLGGVLAGVLGIALTSAVGWQSLFYLGGIMVLLAPIYFFALPESPEFLVAQGRTEKAFAILARMRPENVEAYQQATLVVGGQEAAVPQDWRLPLGRPYRTHTLFLWGAVFLLMFAAYGLTAWTPTLMIDRGLGINTAFVLGSTLQCMAIAGGLLGAFFADKSMGAGHLVMLWCVLGAVSSVGVALSGPVTLVVITVMAAGLFIQGALWVLFSVCAQSYPVEARSTGEGLMFGVGYWGGVLGPFIAGTILSALGSDNLIYFVVAGATALAIACVRQLSDTRHSVEGAAHVPSPSPSVDVPERSETADTIGL